MVHYAAGCLPITWHRGKLLFLVGRDVRDGNWSDFGGKSERYDRADPLATATRELYEETYGTLLGVKAIRALLRPETAVMLESHTQNNHRYSMYVMQVPYTPHLKNVFTKVVNYIKSRNSHRLWIEKTAVEWVTWNELQAIPKRSVFETTVNKHLQFFRQLAVTPSKGWRAICFARSGAFEHSGTKK